MKKTPGITITDEARRQATAALRGYVADNMEEEIGDLKAGLLLDFVLLELGPTIYNQALADAQAFLEERVSDLAACSLTEFPTSMRRKRP